MEKGCSENEAIIQLHNNCRHKASWHLLCRDGQGEEEPRKRRKKRRREGLDVIGIFMYRFSLMGRITRSPAMTRYVRWRNWKNSGRRHLLLNWNSRKFERKRGLPAYRSRMYGIDNLPTHLLSLVSDSTVTPQMATNSDHVKTTSTLGIMTTRFLFTRGLTQSSSSELVLFPWASEHPNGGEELVLAAEGGSPLDIRAFARDMGTRQVTQLALYLRNCKSILPPLSVKKKKKKQKNARMRAGLSFGLLVVSAIFSSGVHGARSRKQIGNLMASKLAEMSPLGRFMLDKLREELSDQLDPPPYVDVALDDQILPCSYERRVLSARPEDISAGITSRLDFEFIPASEPATVNILNSTARVDTSSSTWSSENSQSLGMHNVSQSDFGNGLWFGSMVVGNSHDMTDSQWQSGDKSTVKEVSVDVSTVYVCPANTLCRVETWTYAASIRGISTLVPMVDSKCYEAWARENYQDFPSDYEADHFDSKLSNDAFYAYIAFRRLSKTNPKLLDSNLSIPSVHEQVPQWTKFGAPYYNIYKLDEAEEKEQDEVDDDDADDDGHELARDQDEMMANAADAHYPFFRVLPSHYEDDAWWADEDKYGVEFNIHERDTIKIPTLHYDGNPKRTQVMLEIPIPRFGWNVSRHGARFKRHADPADFLTLDEQDLRAAGIKYKLLWTNVCEGKKGGEGKMDCGWER
ncbi:hypothetical protein L249_0022 [Ophiocordyceps polyrhachis-furcata BCC 54312]|uniref:Uncharacterized protein n=1 Tax=Ophiocordyceps polyrhachis-furcata BCC 54312 TaxID=1330021 RepID=A0A367LCR5_9HYPO|nr:hypothetical protein L249_0022 [Ophiocordyceps polyrhachis-furcata BCC 54312]